MVKYLIVVFLLSAIVFAQAPAQGPSKDQAETALNAAGCGPSQILFDFTVDKNQHLRAQPEAGKALVYVINRFQSAPKIGLDGSWVGALRPPSYLYFSVEPGQHRLCMSQQGDHFVGSATSFSATAGQVYYFQTSNKEGSGWQYWDLKAIDPAKAFFLIASSALSTSHPKK